MSEFPSRVYIEAQSQFLGKEAITIPSLLNVLNEGELIRGKSVLDVGCGNGRFSGTFLEWGAETVTGIDPSEDMIRACLEAYGGDLRLSFHCHPAQELKEQDCYGLVLAIHVLQFMETVADLKKTCKAVFDALEENSTFIGLVPNGVEDFNPSVEEGASIEKPTEPLRDGLPMKVVFYKQKEVAGSGSLHFFWRETYEKALREAGFDAVTWQTPVIADWALEKYGEDYFHSYLNPPKDIFFIATKSSK